ncbi:MAG: hypothetical protein JSU00_27055 [Acidobacteria bacterium]|nr:hypothetical protein [Acidobacteriota bacterium]
MTFHKYNCDCGCMGLGPAMNDLKKEMGVAGDHFRAAHLEFLKGIRAFVDNRIESLSKQQEPDKGTTVPVE